MPNQPKPFEFTLTAAEADEIRNAQGEGGHQGLQHRLVQKLGTGLTLQQNNAELGEVIRYMTQYKGGGFQARLRSAFERLLRSQLGF